MKRLLLMGVLALAFTGSAFAATTTYSGSASGSQYWSQQFTTSTQGDITVSVSFAPKQTRYTLYINDVTNGGVVCSAKYDSRLPGQQMPLTCIVANAPAGTYEIRFGLQNGRVDLTATVSTP